MQTITKRGVLAALPIRHDELFDNCPTQRHVRRMQEVVGGLKRKGLIHVTDVVVGKDKDGVEQTMPFYSKADGVPSDREVETYQPISA